MLIKNGSWGITGFLDLAIVPIKAALMNPARPEPPLHDDGARTISLMEEAGGVSVEKLLVSGDAAAVQSKAMEMIKASRKMILEGFPLEQIAAWCFAHNYRWRFHKHSPARNAFILEPGKKFDFDAKEAGAKT